MQPSSLPLRSRGRAGEGVPPTAMPPPQPSPRLRRGEGGSHTPAKQVVPRTAIAPPAVAAPAGESGVGALGLVIFVVDADTSCAITFALVTKSVSTTLMMRRLSMACMAMSMAFEGRERAR